LSTPTGARDDAGGVGVIADEVQDGDEQDRDGLVEEEELLTSGLFRISRGLRRSPMIRPKIKYSNRSGPTGRRQRLEALGHRSRP
jgi:hypothetical protein